MSQSAPSPAVDDAEKIRRYTLEHFIFIGWVALSLVGIAVTNISPIVSFWYWLSMLPVFAATAIVSEWSQARQQGLSVVNLVMIQIAHWSGAVLSLLVTYSFWANGRWTNEDTGLVILLTLALTVFLDGPHCGWRFYLAGIFLFVVAIIAAYIKYFMWIVTVLGILVVAVGLYIEEKHPLPTTKKHPRTPAAPRVIDEDEED